MFKDKLVILTYKNTIYQSKLKLWAIFVTILVCKQHTLFFKPILRVHSLPYRGGVILIDLNLSSPDTNSLLTHFPRNISWKPLFGVLDEFLLTSVQVWEKKSDWKKSDKIVDTVTLMCHDIKYGKSSIWHPHLKNVKSRITKIPKRVYLKGPIRKMEA